MPDLADSNTFVSSPVIQDTIDLLTLKLDRQTGSNNTFSGHYSLFNENRFNPFDPVNAFTSLPGYGSHHHQPRAERRLHLDACLQPPLGQRSTLGL